MTYFITLILFFIILSLGGIHGRILNDRLVYGNTTYGGPTYHCVDFYEQPTFSHPSLKHLVPKEKRNSTVQKKVEFNEIDGCPSGTVPIASSTGVSKVRFIPAKVHCYAVVRTKLIEGSNRQFFGTSALESLNKPKAKGIQWSSSRFKLWVGSECILAGWEVFPDYYKDEEAHFFVTYAAGTTLCFNTDCPGFVQKSSRFQLGAKPDRYSEPQIGGTQFLWDIAIELDKDTGDWHLYLTSKTLGREEIGYWPGSLFKQLNKAAAQVEWGGEINDPAQLNPAPEMGSGVEPGNAKKYSAFFSEVVVLDENSKYVSPQGTEEFSDCPDLYFIRDGGDQGDNGRFVYFGGGQQTYD